MPSTIKDNYFGRSGIQSSTSNYIQTITTNPDGSDRVQSVLDNTPDAKIITPQLKKDVNEVKALGGDVKDKIKQELTNNGSLIYDEINKIKALILKTTDVNELSKLMAQLAKLTLEIDSVNTLLNAPTYSLANDLSGALPIAPMPVKKDIEEPKPTGEKAEYGKIVAKETKGGFVEIRDETPGNTRKIDMHPTGTYNATLDNGSTVEKVTDKKLTMIDKDWEITVFENEIVIINKDAKIQIKQNRITNILAEDHLNIDGNQFQKIGKDRIEDIGQDESLKIGGNEVIAVGGWKKETIGSDNTLVIGGNSDTNVGGDKNEMVSGSLSITVNGPVTISSSSQVSIQAPKISLG